VPVCKPMFPEPLLPPESTMPFKIPNEGEIEFLKLVTADNNNWQVKLYSAPRTPTDTDTVANYTEANFNGYDGNRAPQNWTTPTTNMTGFAQSTADPLDFNFTGGPAQTIYGYFVVKPTVNKLLWAEQ